MARDMSTGIRLGMDGGPKSSHAAKHDRLCRRRISFFFVYALSLFLSVSFARLIQLQDFVHVCVCILSMVEGRHSERRLLDRGLWTEAGVDEGLSGAVPLAFGDMKAKMRTAWSILTVVVSSERKETMEGGTKQAGKDGCGSVYPCKCR